MNGTWRRVSGLLISSLCILCCISMKLALPIPVHLDKLGFSLFFFSWKLYRMVAKQGKQVKFIFYVITIRGGVCKGRDIH